MVLDSHEIGKPENGVKSERPKQTLVLLTILTFSLSSAIITGLHKEQYCGFNDIPFPAPGVLLLLILSEYTGRRTLFIALFLLSLLSSIVDLFQTYIISFIIFAPVQGATVALISVVICEYCDPKQRFFYLILNSAIQSLFCTVTIYALYTITDLLLYFNILVGAVGLWLVFKWPESPYWLASKKRFEECARAFVEVRGGNSESSEELKALIEARLRPSSIKMFYAPMLMAIPVMCMVFPPVDLIFLFTHIEFHEKLVFDPETSTGMLTNFSLFLVLKCVAAVASVVCVFIPVKVSRKALFLACALLFAGHIYILDLIEYVGEQIKAPDHVIYFTEFILYLAVDSGPRTVALPLLVEMFSQQYVSIITAIISVLCILTELYTCNGPFGMFGCIVVFLTFLICYFVMPEAKNKTLLQIEQSYLPKEKNDGQSTQTEL